MRKYLILLLTSMIVISSHAQSDSFIGDWMGKLNVGVELRLVLHVKNEGGKFTSTLDSPDQAAFGLPAESTVISNDRIEVTLKNLGASFSGRLLNDSTIDGNFTQGRSFPLTLKRIYEKIEIRRPQEPKPPFPYRTEDIEYDNADKSLHYGATLTIPNGAGPFPAVVLISGSGAQDRDGALMGHRPFLVLADALTKNGIAVLRVDDRGKGKSSGSFKNVTSADFAKDVNTSVDYLLSRPEVNKKKLGLIGHSEGGMIAPMVATGRKDIAFVVLLAGPGIKIDQLMNAQNDAFLLSNGVNKNAVEKYSPAYKKIMEIMVSTEDTAKAINESISYLEQWKKETDASVVTELGLASDEAIKNMVQSMMGTINDKWFKYFIKFDPQPYLQKLGGKVLALNGDKDIQVIAAPNLEGIEKALKKSKVKSFQVKSLPGLNHLFQHCTQCTVSEYSKIEETFAPEAIKEINEWLNKEVK